MVFKMLFGMPKVHPQSFFDQSFLELLTVFSRMDLISRFDTSTCPFFLWVVCEGCAMSHSILVQDFVNHLIAEMCTVICNQCSESAEP